MIDDGMTAEGQMTAKPNDGEAPMTAKPNDNQRWPEVGMPKCQVIYDPALTINDH